MSISSGKSKRHKNLKVENLSPLNSNGGRNVSDLVNNNRNIPRVSINSTSQLCLGQDSRVFPYMQVYPFYSLLFTLLKWTELHLHGFIKVVSKPLSNPSLSMNI